MKTKILTLLFLALAQFAFAQKEPMSYEWFEKQSKIISDLQYKTTGQNGRNYAKDNFTVYYNDKKASYSYTHTVNNTEYTTVIEDVDFSKATGLDIEDNIVYVAFPDHSITEQVYGGKEYQYVKTGLLAFYPNSKDDRAKMLFELYHIITELKIDKGLITRTDAIKQWKDYKALKPYEFYQKHPKSVLAYEGKLMKEDYERQVRFVKSFLNRYNMPVFNETTVSQYSKINPEIIDLVKKYKKRTTWNIFIPLDSKDWLEKKDAKNFLNSIRTHNFSGYCSSYEEDYNDINRMGYTVLFTNSYNEAQQEYNRIIVELKDNIDLQFFPSDKQKENETGVVLSEKGKIGKDLMVNKAYRITIKINTHKIKKELWYQLEITAASTQEDFSCAR